MNSIRSVVVAFLFALLLAACASQQAKPPEEGEGGASVTTEEGAQATPLGEAGALGADPLSDPGSPLSQRVIYFDFDSYQVKPEYLDLISAHGQYLAANPQQKIRLEGHTDERGTREYNIALGERRAAAVQQLLLLQGVLQEQIELVSYGEELPVSLGHDEESWALNRRVEMNYLNR